MLIVNNFKKINKEKKWTLNSKWIQLIITHEVPHPLINNVDKFVGKYRFIVFIDTILTN